jgi:hypothetical protein
MTWTWRGTWSRVERGRGSRAMTWTWRGTWSRVERGRGSRVETWRGRRYVLQVIRELEQGGV